MQFSVGDKVMYPHRGAGIITGIEHGELVDGFEHYYVIEIESQRLTLRVPMRMVEELGVRRVMPATSLDEVWATLSRRPRPLADDFKERQEHIRAKLRSGDPVKVAQAVRDLSWREQQSYLTKADAELLAQGLELLIAEIAAVMDKDIGEVESMVNSALSRHVVA
ncbi:MAG: CarD family transcriptional regulator [Anaerolineae bacterium]|nr:CarD family transcriptional regulator [Anaerolineae bacterium]